MEESTRALSPQGRWRSSGFHSPSTRLAQDAWNRGGHRRRGGHRKQVSADACTSATLSAVGCGEDRLLGGRQAFRSRCCHVSIGHHEALRRRILKPMFTAGAIRRCFGTWRLRCRRESAGTDRERRGVIQDLPRVPMMLSAEQENRTKGVIKGDHSLERTPCGPWDSPSASGISARLDGNAWALPLRICG